MVLVDTSVWVYFLRHGDEYLAAATKISPHTHLWTRDKRLAAIEEELDIAFASH